MTTIVMVEHDGDVLIGADSLLSASNYKVQSVSPKVVVNNGVVYGVSGSQEAFNMIAHGAVMPTPPTDTDTAGWVTTRLAPELRKILDKVAPRRGDDFYDIGILAVVDGRVFEFSGMLGWHQTTGGEYAIGSGSSYALGALSAGATVEDAVQIAAMHDPGTGGMLQCTTANALLAKAGYAPATLTVAAA